MMPIDKETALALAKAIKGEAQPEAPPKSGGAQLLKGLSEKERAGVRVASQTFAGLPLEGEYEGSAVAKSDSTILGLETADKREAERVKREERAAKRLREEKTQYIKDLESMYKMTPAGSEEAKAVETELQNRVGERLAHTRDNVAIAQITQVGGGNYENGKELIREQLDAETTRLEAEGVPEIQIIVHLQDLLAMDGLTLKDIE